MPGRSLLSTPGLKPWRCLCCGQALGMTNGQELIVGGLAILWGEVSCGNCQHRRQWTPAPPEPDKSIGK